MPVMAPAQPAQQIGGNYTAEQCGDGTYILKDVPIFAYVPAGEKRNTVPIGAAWMRAALQKHQMRVAEGHLPPVHVYHSDETAVKPEPAGKLRLTRLGEITYEGARVPALFADIVEIPGAVFERIQKRLLPYRSVEVHDWDDPEIDSLALMPTDVPFFRMAMTTVGRVVQRTSTRIPDRVGHRTPAYSFRRTALRRGAMILFRFDDKPVNFAGGNMAVTKVRPAGIPDKGAITTPKDQADLGPSSGVNTERVAAETENPVDFEVEGTAPGGKDDPEVQNFDEIGAPPPPAGGGGGDPMQQILALLQEIKAALSPKAAPEPETPDMAPVATARAGQAPVRILRPNTQDTERVLLRAMGPMLARVKTLEGELATRKRGEAIEFKLQEAAAALMGYDLDTETLTHFRRCAEVGGEKMLLEAVEQFKRIAAPEPPLDGDDFEAQLAAAPAGAGDEVHTFAAAHPGPENMEWIRGEIRKHADYVRLTGSEITQKDWLETNHKFRVTA